MQRLATAIIATLLCTSSASAETLPQYGLDRHIGAASCATINGCHNETKPAARYGIRQDEYAKWNGTDPHSKAFRVLKGAAGKAMARALGLPAADTADVCLDCHTDNVPRPLRGMAERSKFRIEVGVGCEACHGGAERWIDSHVRRDAPGARDGMYPTANPAARAELCLSCHLGTATKFVDHRMYAAGHPRLSFELASDTFRYPHFEFDADYQRRHSGLPSHGTTWALGQIAAARRTLDLLLVYGASHPPEFALRSCDDCHHPRATRVRSPERTAALGGTPGIPRIDDRSLRMVRYFLEESDRKEFDARLKVLQTAVQESDVRSAAQALLVAFDGPWRVDLARPIAARDAARILREIARDARDGRFDDEVAARQVYFAGLATASTIMDEVPGAADRRAVNAGVAGLDQRDPARVPALVAALASLFDGSSRR